MRSSFKEVVSFDFITILNIFKGGTGKTVLMKALLYNLLAENKNVACVAHTGVAATLLPMGTTAHRQFHIPLEVEETMSCEVHLESTEGIQKYKHFLTINF